MKVKNRGIEECKLITFKVSEDDLSHLKKIEADLMMEKKTSNPKEISAADVLRRAIRSYK